MSAPEPYWADEDVTLHLGDCLDVLRTLEADSIDAIVTDPPAGIAFMDREWDDFRRARNPADAGRDNVFGRTSAHGPEYGRRDRGQFVQMLTERMAEAYRVLKPGGHALVWSIPRTSHWTAWALEDAGFDVRDCVLHLFGSGFPKSLDVSKAIDKLKRRDYVLAAIELGLEVPGNNLHDWTKAEHSPGDEWWERFKAHLSPGDWRLIERAVVGRRTTGIGTGRGTVTVISDSENRDVTAPATEDATRWEGWGTALKPGQEMWWLARKPLKNTVAANVLEFGTGALNIDECRVATTDSLSGGAATRGSASHADGWDRPWKNDPVAVAAHAARVAENVEHAEALGRWPANITFTHSADCTFEDAGDMYQDWCAPDCPVAELDRQSGVSISRKGSIRASANAMWGRPDHVNDGTSEYSDTGGASRFYPVFRYQAKAPSSERPRLDDGTAHETVKSLGLMSWLVRLITPPGGTVLDMYAGSGPTGEACIIEGFRCILIEQDPKSAELIKTRLRKPIQPVMFGFDEAS